jgi:hypothetical protein
MARKGEISIDIRARMRRIARRAGAVAVAAALLPALLLVTGCGDDDDDSGTETEAGAAALPQGADPVNLDPADFTTEITNPYWPMKPGSRWVYRETDKDEVKRVVVTVTDQTRQIANGIEARVVHDVVSQDGEPVEVTDDWYAQDSEGNIWYLGEDTAEYENGKVVSREGSFEAGVDGAQPGIAVPGNPEPGLAYRQEYLAGEAEDKAKVLSLDATASAPFGSFEGVLQTEDVNPLSEPPSVEHKFYARDVGPVLVIGISGGGGREELISYTS